jgi:hypothetical protein
MVDTGSPEFNHALDVAAQECGLQDYYRDCVRPLLQMPVTQWPACCAGNCEPCAQTLAAVAHRVCELLGIAVHDLQ